jgi:hypothetical protein
VDKGGCLDFLYDLAASFVENYATSVDDLDPEIFLDFETTMLELMEEHGQAMGEGERGFDHMKNKQFCGIRDSQGSFLILFFFIS